MNEVSAVGGGQEGMRMESLDREIQLAQQADGPWPKAAPVDGERFNQVQPTDFVYFKIQ